MITEFDLKHMLRNQIYRIDDSGELVKAELSEADEKKISWSRQCPVKKEPGMLVMKIGHSEPQLLIASSILQQ